MDERDGRIAAIERCDNAHVGIGHANSEFFGAVAEVDRTRAWADDGARDLAQWLWMRYGMSDWKARRLIETASALPHLPAISQVLDRGELGVDKVVELARFAQPDTEDGLIPWAQKVSAARIRHAGDVARQGAPDEAANDDAMRSVTWAFHEEGRSFELHADLPAAQGAVVATTIDRVAASVPRMPHEQGGIHVSARRADALVGLCSARLATDPDPDRATVVIHARVGATETGTGAEVEGGGVTQRSTLERLLCAARVETVHEAVDGRVIGMGRITRVPPPWLLRQVRYRDGGCRFPGCGTKAFTQAHHIVFWREGGATDLDNLATLCSWHHKLVHEYGWWIKGGAQGDLRWYRPDGTPYVAGPAPTHDPPALTDTG